MFASCLDFLLEKAALRIASGLTIFNGVIPRRRRSGTSWFSRSMRDADGLITASAPVILQVVRVQCFVSKQRKHANICSCAHASACGFSYSVVKVGTGAVFS
eukprot:m.364165 g.364165  ORF g.364165 m.364165 type:complete len:102 (-) comp28077_c0_seq2:117-422(-)